MRNRGSLSGRGSEVTGQYREVKGVRPEGM